MVGSLLNDFVANLQASLSAKEFRKSVNIWGSYRQEFSVLFFWTYGVTNNADNKITHHTSTQQQ